MSSAENRILNIREVCRRTSLGKSSIYDLIQAGAFPSPVRISKGRVGWHEGETDDWIASRPVARDAEASGTS